MNVKSSLTPLLESIIQDNPTFKFPVELIDKELVSMFLHQEEFEYFMMQSFKKLKKEYGSMISHIYLTHLEMKLDLSNENIYNLTQKDYQDRVEGLITSLEKLQITRIDKDSPDGVLMSAMEQ
jgi:hypothetical protein